MGLKTSTCEDEISFKLIKLSWYIIFDKYFCKGGIKKGVSPHREVIYKLHPYITKKITIFYQLQYLAIFFFSTCSYFQNSSSLTVVSSLSFSLLYFTFPPPLFLLIPPQTTTTATTVFSPLKIHKPMSLHRRSSFNNNNSGSNQKQRWQFWQ